MEMELDEIEDVLADCQRAARRREPTRRCQMKPLI
jgi:hypothetical protein